MISMRRNSQAGNVFMIILLAIAMFGALAFTISRSMRSSSVTTMSERTVDLAASDMISFAQGLQRAVDRVRSNGCSENEISFENPVVAGYANAGTPSDKCKIFSPDGGAATWRKAPEGAATDLNWRFLSNKIGKADGTKIFGTTGEDLVVALSGVNIQVCDKINEKVSGYTSWESTGAHNATTKFIGAFTAGGDGINRANLWPIPESGCFCDTGGTCSDTTTNVFYHTLLTR